MTLNAKTKKEIPRCANTKRNFRNTDGDEGEIFKQERGRKDRKFREWVWGDVRKNKIH